MGVDLWVVDVRFINQLHPCKELVNIVRSADKGYMFKNTVVTDLLLPVSMILSTTFFVADYPSSSSTPLAITLPPSDSHSLPFVNYALTLTMRVMILYVCV